MARVNRLMERRALRRAADQALLTSLDNVAPSQAGGPADRDFVYRGSDRASTHDHEPATEPIPVAAVEEFAPEADSVELPPEQPVDIYDLMPDQTGDSEWDDVGLAQAADHAVTASTDDYRWLERDDVLPLAPSRPLKARRVAEPASFAPVLDFAVSDTERWYRTKPATGVLVAAVIAAVVCVGWLLFRSPGTTAEESNADEATSAPPSPSTAAPTAVSAPKPPPSPPPPPPPPAAQPTYSAPQWQYSPSYGSPNQQRKPRVDVTRAPMSVAPVPRPVPGSDSNTPGDAPERDKPRRRGCFGFC